MRWMVYRRSLRDVHLYVRDTAYLWSTRSSPIRHAEGILVVRTDGIGDFVVWLNAAQSLRKAYPEAHITLVANALWAELAADLQLFDEVIPVRPDRLALDVEYRHELFDRIRSRSYDLALHPAYTRSRRFRDAESIMRVSHARKKVGFDGEPVLQWQRVLAGTWYDQRIPADTRMLPELERNAAFLRGLGIRDINEGPSEIPWTPRSVPPGDYYVLSPGAGAPLRRWDCAHFAELADRIYAETGWLGVISGGPGEEKLGEEIREMAVAPLIDAIGTTSISGLVDIIAAAEFVVGNETGSAHIAAAVSTPCICITGGGHYGRFVPYDDAGEESWGPIPVEHHMPCFGCNWDCVFTLADDEAAPCISMISVDDVWEKIAVQIRSDAGRNDLKIRAEV